MLTPNNLCKLHILNVSWIPSSTEAPSSRSIPLCMRRRHVATSPARDALPLRPFFLDVHGLSLQVPLLMLVMLLLLIFVRILRLLHLLLRLILLPLLGLLMLNHVLRICWRHL